MAETKMKKAVVHPETGPAQEVEVPVDSPDPLAAAVVAWRFKYNAWHDPRKIVSVTFPEEQATPANS